MLGRILLAVGVTFLVSGCAADATDGEDVSADEEALGDARHTVIADVDEGGGVIVANRPGGFYMGRLLPGMTFDRQGAWYRSKENGTDYAWGTASGHSDACLWIGPSRGKPNETAGKWASAGKRGKGGHCTDAQKQWLIAGDSKNIASHWNCPPPTSSAHGTEKTMLHDAPLYWNVTWSGAGYDGGPARDEAAVIKKGTKVWYRYTTNDGKHMVVFVPGTGWGFMPVGAIDRTHTGHWSFPTKPGELHRC